MGTVVSIGYEGFELPDFTACLVEHGVETVVDVRLHPVSRRRGFSKRRLAEALDRVGITYVHEPELGNPKDNREAFRRGLPQARRRMEELVATVGSPAMARLGAIAQHQRVAVLCVEREHARCHRAVVVDALVRAEPGLQVVQAP